LRWPRTCSSRKDARPSRSRPNAARASLRAIQGHLRASDASHRRHPWCDVASRIVDGATLVLVRLGQRAKIAIRDGQVVIGLGQAAALTKPLIGGQRHAIVQECALVPRLEIRYRAEVVRSARQKEDVVRLRCARERLGEGRVRRVEIAERKGGNAEKVEGATVERCLSSADQRWQDALEPTERCPLLSRAHKRFTEQDPKFRVAGNRVWIELKEDDELRPRARVRETAGTLVDKSLVGVRHVARECVRSVRQRIAREPREVRVDAL